MRVFPLWALVICALPTRAVRAQEPNRVGVEVVSPGADGCISAPQLANGIAATLGIVAEAGFDPSDAAQVQLAWDQAFASGHRLILRVSVDGAENAERALEIDGECARLDDAAVVVAALLVDDALRERGRRTRDLPLTISPEPMPRQEIAWTLATRALATLRIGNWPGLAFGAGIDAEFGIRLDPTWAIAVVAGLVAIPSYEAEVGAARALLTGFSGRLAMGARVEMHPAIRLSALLGGSFGWTQGEGRGIDVPQIANRYDGSIDIEIALRFAIVGPFAVRIAGGAFVPMPPLVIRYRDGSGAVIAAHEGAVVGAQASLALELESFR
jgi:hypothetical protein